MSFFKCSRLGCVNLGLLATIEPGMKEPEITCMVHLDRLGILARGVTGVFVLDLRQIQIQKLQEPLEN